MNFSKNIILKKIVHSRDLKKVDLQRLCSNLHTALQSFDQTEADVSTNSALSAVIDDLAPIVTKSVRDGKFGWFDDRILKAKGARRKAERSYRKTQLGADRQRYISARQNVRVLVTNAREQFYIEKIQNAKSCREIFATSNELLGKKKDSKLPIICPHDEVPEKFSECFASKIKKIRDSFPDDTTVTHDPFLAPSNLTMFEPVTVKSDTIFHFKNMPS